MTTKCQVIPHAGTFPVTSSALQSLPDRHNAKPAIFKVRPIRQTASDIQICNAQGIVDNEIPTRFNNITHQLGKDIIGIISFANFDLQQ